MTFQDIYAKVNVNNVEARVAKNSAMKNVTTDIKVKLEEVIKYNKATDLEGVTIVKKVRAEYKDAYEAFDIAPDSATKVSKMAEAIIAIEYCDTFLPKAIETAEELAPFIQEAVQLSNLDSPTMRDMGKIVGSVKALTNGAADGKLVATEVKAYIQAL